MAKKHNNKINLSSNENDKSIPDLKKFQPQFKKTKKVYSAETINSEIDRLNKSRSMNGEEAKEIAKAAKERGKSDGFVAGALVVGIAWASHALIDKVMEKFSKA